MRIIQQKPPTWFTVVGVLLQLWGLMGCVAFYMQVGPGGAGAMSDYDRALFAALPSWYTAVYGLAVGTGLLGAIALLAKSKLARSLFVASLIAVVVQFGWLFATTDVIAVKGAAVAMPFPVVIAVIAAFQLWLAGLAQRNGWIG